MHTKYSTRVICHDADFRALEPEWDRLVGEAVDANTFLTHAWLYSWWSAYRPRAQLHIVLAERDGRILGIAPLMCQRDRGLSGVIRRLRFIGDGTSETDHMNFIVFAGDRRRILDVLLTEVDRTAWDVGHFSQMPEASDNTAQLLEHGAMSGWMLDSRPIGCPLRRLPRSYEELLKALPGRLRTAVRSARRDLETTHHVEFGLCETNEELPEALNTLYRQHAGRWQAKGESGVFVDARKRDFYSKLSARLLGAGALRFFYLKLDGKVVAQQFCFEYGGTVLLLQEGFDIEHAKENVGNVLRAMVFEYLIAHGAHTYDFLAGTSRHKKSWSDTVLNDLNIRACRPTLAGRAAYFASRLLDKAKRMSVAAVNASSS